MYDYRENDKIVWLFTPISLGGISAVAKGAKVKANYFLLPYFCFGEYSYSREESMYVLTEGKIIESFQGF